LVIRIPTDMRNDLFLGHTSLFDPAILSQNERLQHSVTVEELYDINFLWPKYWRELAAELEAAVLYTLGEFDSLWRNSLDDVKAFGDGFVRSKQSGWGIVLAPSYYLCQDGLLAQSVLVCGFAQSSTNRKKASESYPWGLGECGISILYSTCLSD
jgi:hypothetical protein